MKKISGFLLLLPLLLLAGCFNGPPLITGDYSRIEIAKDGELVFETDDARDIEEAIEAINSGRREETHEWELPEPIGTVSFQGADEGLSLALFEDGVTVNEYFVFVDFDFD